ncbi:winged helix-turn-helix domain-containing protein, partial [Bacillus velezensis]|nr:winged helix-turn-helix domain-containing protein [Bacillus velezensis]
IKAQLRRAPARAAESTAPQPERYAFGKFSNDRTDRTVVLPDGSTPDLTSAEVDLLWALVCHAREVVSRDDLMLHLRGVEFDVQRTGNRGGQRAALVGRRRHVLRAGHDEHRQRDALHFLAQIRPLT